MIDKNRAYEYEAAKGLRQWLTGFMIFIATAIVWLLAIGAYHLLK